MSTRDIATRLCLGLFWFAQTGGVVILYIFLAPKGSTATDTAVLVPSVMIALALVGRWVLIPRFTSLPPVIVTYVIGVVVATAAGVVSIFYGGTFIREVVYIVIATMLTYFPVFRLPPAKPTQPPPLNPTVSTID